MLLLTLLLLHQLAGNVATNNISCWLEADGDYRDDITMYIKQGAKLIEINVQLPGHPTDMLDIVCQHVRKPYQWIRTTSRHGRTLLMLDENYRHMSLSTLTIGVETMSINVTDHPPRCLRGKSEEETLNIFRESFLRGLVSPQEPQGTPLGFDDHICNMHVMQENKQAVFRYRCCRRHQDGEITCENMNKDDWINFLLALIIIIKVLVILCSPMFLPENLYRQKYVASPYIFHVPGPALGVKIVVTQHPDHYGPQNACKRVRLSDLGSMEYFKTMIATTRWEHDRIYEVKVADVRLSVKSRRLLGQSKVPVTISRLLYNSFLRCRISRLDPLKQCCSTNIFGRLNPGLKIVTWYKCMKIFASFLLLILMAVPWFIRVASYYIFEEPVVQSKIKSAERLGLDPPSAGNVVLYLSPVHGLFIVMYVIFILDSLFIGVVSKAVKDKLKTVVQQCLRDMKERPKLLVVGWLTRLIVKPFTFFGIFGILFFVPYLIVLLLVAIPICAFYMFPTLNLSIRLIIQFFIFVCPSGLSKECESSFSSCLPVKKGFQLKEVTAKERFIKRKHFSSRSLILQLLAIFMCLVTFWSLTLLVMEICSFFVEVFVYTFIGLIVNAGVSLQYLSVLLLVVLYCKDVFTNVQTVYLNFQKVIHKELLDMVRPEVNEIAKKEALDQENTVFNVKGEMATNRGQTMHPKIVVKDGKPCWMTKGMLVFLDKQDTPFTPEKFFHKTIDLNYYSCPGPIYKNVGNAVLELLRIILFLLFVVLVVMAFGDAYSISSTNQLLATVAGGFLPFMFRLFFGNEGQGRQFDTNSIQFKTEFHKAINDFTQLWPVHDIVSADVKLLDESRDKVATSEAKDKNANSKDADSQDDASVSLESENDDETNEREAPLSDMMSLVIEEEEEEDYENVDIIVDVSTPKIRKLGPLVVRGFEKGSVTMLNGSEVRADVVEV